MSYIPYPCYNYSSIILCYYGLKQHSPPFHLKEIVLHLNAGNSQNKSCQEDFTQRFLLVSQLLLLFPSLCLARIMNAQSLVIVIFLNCVSL